MFDIETELKKLPEKSGVYIMKDINDNIIYVGKAISLKRRVKQYFRKNNKTHFKRSAVLKHGPVYQSDGLCRWDGCAVRGSSRGC